MRYLLDIPAGLYEEMNDLARRKGWKDLSHFIRAAIENQLLMERHPEGPFEEYGKKPVTRVAVKATRPKAEPRTRDMVWMNLRVEDIPWDKIQPTASTQIRDAPILGYYNRQLPLKVSLRVLARKIASEERQAILLEGFHLAAVQVAVEARKYLESLDALLEIPRGARVSVGFPDDRDKSIERFNAHFLGRLKQDGAACGALPEMGFIKIASAQGHPVSITHEGLEFARLPNPVMDGKGQSKNALGPEEVNFLLKHLATHIPMEFAFMKKLLSWISEGKNTPDVLLVHVQKSYPEWTMKVANTMIAGEIGRMQEIDLIEQLRQGLNVTYRLKPKGQAILSGGKGYDIMQ